MSNGGPAFPIIEMDSTFGTRVSEGMTLRDWFAGMALQGLLAGQRDVILIEAGARDFPEAVSCVSEEAYFYADAMLKQRGNSDGTD